jgi:hypothetical protein
MDYARAVGKAQEEDQQDSENKGIKGQCAFKSHFGQCGLRGTIGNAGPKGGTWYCSLHNRVLCREVDGVGRLYDREGIRIQNSIDGMRRVIRIEREQGATRWDHRSIEEWWERADGTIQPAPLPAGCTNVPGEKGPNSGDVDDQLKLIGA